MNKSFKLILITTSFLLTSVAVLNASLDSKTETLSDLVTTDFVVLAEVESRTPDPAEAVRYLGENE